MTEQTPAQEQADFFAALAKHLRAHPDLAEVSPYGHRDYRNMRILSAEPNGSAPAELAAWARSLGVESLTSLPLPDETWSSVDFRGHLGRFPVRAWAKVDDLPKDVTELTVAELEHFAEHGTLPEAGAR